MRFEPTTEQLEFQASVRSLLQRHWSPRHLRVAWDGQLDDALQVWARLAELGVLGLVVPEVVGGAGATHVELVLAMEEIGYAGYPLPVGETAGVVADALAQDPRGHAPLKAMLSGRAQTAVSTHPDLPVPYALRADQVLALREETVHLVPGASCEWVAVPTQDPTRAVGRGNPPTSPSTLIATGPTAQRASAALWVVHAAELLGLSQRMIDLTRDYVLDRRQFGVPIGAFQALKHRLADCAVSVEAARGLTWYAAYALEAEPEAALLAARTAKSAASSAAWLTNQAALQLHGGIGFTWEHDLHLWLKRAQALERAHGNTADHRLHIGRLLVDQFAPIG